MGDLSQRLGWRRATELVKWQPSDRHPNYVPLLPSPPSNDVTETGDGAGVTPRNHIRTHPLPVLPHALKALS